MDTRIEQIKLIQRHMPVVLGGNLIASVLLYLALRGVVSNENLLAWLIAIAVVTVIRAVLLRVHIRYPTDRDNVQKRSFTLLLFSAVSGTLWGFAGVALFSLESPVHGAMVMLILAGMVAGSLASTSAYLPIYFVYAIPALAPMGVYLLFLPENIYKYMGIAILIFLLVNLVYSRNIQKTILQILDLQFKNVELIDQLREQTRLAEQANIAKSRFLAAASHDLRQPLHAMGLFTESLHPHVTQPGLIILSRLKDSIQALRELFNALLDVSRLDANVVEPNLEGIALLPFLEKIIAEVQEEAAEKKLNLMLRVAETQITSDRVLLSRVFRNLLSNAIHFTDQGSVVVESQDKGETVEIVITDQGCGIPASELDNIFSEYHQLNNPERDRNKGLGLGLAIVKRICNLLEIPLGVVSKPGRGSTFSIELPISEGKSEPSLTALTANQSANLQNRVVLVVDDDRDVLEATSEILSNWGCSVLLAESASDAIEQIVEQDVVPNVLISDYRLRQNETGDVAIRQIREELNEEIPAIIITGDTSIDRIRRASATGLALLHKPIAPDELKSAIVNAIT